MPLFNRDPEEDEAYGRWLAEQANPSPPAFDPIGPSAHPIALDARREESPAYGDAGRPRDILPDVMPEGVTAPSYWYGQPDYLAPRARPGPRSAPISPSPMLADRQPRFPGSDVHVVAPMRSGGSGGGFGGDDAGLVLAMFADLAINKGRGGADILKHYQGAPDRELDRELKQAQIDRVRAQAAQPGGGRGPSPELLELQRERLEIAKQRLAGSQEAAARKAEEEEALGRLDSPETKAYQDAAIAAGADERTMRMMTGQQIRAWRPQIGQQVQQDRGQANWGDRFQRENREHDRRAAASEQRQLDQEARAEGRAVAKEEREAEREGEKRYAAGAAEYAQENQGDLTIAALIQDAEQIPGGVAPKTIGERLRGALGTWTTTDPMRMQGWQIKQLILEEWGRSRSGAAIGATEGEKFALQTGASSGASALQVETAFNVMKRVIARHLAARAVGNPQAAIDVGGAYGLDQTWFPKPKPRKRAAPAGPAEKPGETVIGEDGDEYEVLP